MTASQLAETIAKSGALLHGNRVAVARERRVTKTKSGLFLPDTAQERQSFAIVIMKGTECTLPVEVGDSLYVPIYGGVALKQPAGGKVYALEVLHAKDVFVSWKAKEDVELEDDADGAMSTEGTTKQTRTLRNQL
jgi:chaperonin GroES